MNIRVGIILFLLAVVIRLWNLDAAFNFGSDQGLHLLDMYDIYVNRKLTLIGPPSSFVVEGRSFFTGSGPYYLLIPWLVMFRWDPTSIAYLLILVQSAAITAVSYLLLKRYPLSGTGWYFFFLSTFSTVYIDHSRYLWHPNFLIPISTMLMGLAMVWDKRRRSVILLFLMGLGLGFGLQYHYSYFLAVWGFVIWFLFRRIPKVSWLVLASGFVCGFFPIILFEFRHQFYNLRTMMLYGTQVVFAGKGAYGSGIYYYLFPILPFIILIGSYGLDRVRQRSRLMVWVFLGGYIAFCLYRMIPVPSSGYTMTQGWNYSGVNKVAEIIVQDEDKPFNIVDVLTGDTRALAVRFLLTKGQHPPLPVTAYPDAEVLYVYSRVPIEEILKGSLWEIDVKKPVYVVRQWDIQNGILLYRLEPVHGKI